jgi:hypothetical protein
MQVMGDETKETEFDKGNTKPLEGPLKPSTADALEIDAPEIAQVPDSERELPRNDALDR